MKIGLYFGSFNPIHTGHCIIANHIANNTNLAQVWLVVSPQNPLKPSAGLLNEYQRLHLVKLAIEGIDSLRATDIEFHLPRPSYTIDTLTYLKEKFPQHEFAIVMGSDGLQNLHKWKNAEQLIKEYPFYVYPRPGFPREKGTGDAKEKDKFPKSEEKGKLLPANINWVDAPMLDISATFIRDQIRAGKNIKFLVPDAVALEIEKNGYFKQ
jgi:nicotinate-nucleotide adenylyltransferase